MRGGPGDLTSGNGEWGGRGRGRRLPYGWCWEELRIRASKYQGHRVVSGSSLSPCRDNICRCRFKVATDPIQSPDAEIGALVVCRVHLFGPILRQMSRTYKYICKAGFWNCNSQIHAKINCGMRWFTASFSWRDLLFVSRGWCCFGRHWYADC